MERMERVPIGDVVLYDIASMSFPWAPGEVKPEQKNAIRCRVVQRQLGLAAVKAEIMALVGDFRRMRLSEAAFARQLDVPPEIIPQWVAARDAQDQDHLLNTEALARVSRDHADLSDAIAQLNMKLAEPNIGMRVFAQLTQQKTRLIEQRAKLLERHGLDKFTFDERTDEVKDIQRAILELCEDNTRDRQILITDGIDPDAISPRHTPEHTAAGRAAYEKHLADHPDVPLPEFREDDPFGWRPSPRNRADA
jgi:hypothetical protein